MRAGFSLAAFAMIKASSDTPSECVMPTSVSNQESITSTILQCYSDSGISLYGSSFAKTASSTSSSSDSDLIIVGTDVGFASTSSDSSTDSDFSAIGTDFSSDFSAIGTDFSADGSAFASINSDASVTTAKFCASSSCKQMIVIFKELWPTDCTIDGSSLYDLIDEVNTECGWTSATTSDTTSLTGSSALALAATSAAALLLLV